MQNIKVMEEEISGLLHESLGEQVPAAKLLEVTGEVLAVLHSGVEIGSRSGALCALAVVLYQVEGDPDAARVVRTLAESLEAEEGEFEMACRDVRSRVDRANARVGQA